MARRGEALREHIIDRAKLAFLEDGFERTSMDAIAARAETSKRSLYAHFPTKDALFVAVIERARALFAARMRTPTEYSDQPAEAVADADRLPALAAGLYNVLFETTTADLTAHLTAAFGLAVDQAEVVAGELIGLVVHPVLPRLLFGIDPLTDELPDETRLTADVDLDRIEALFRLVMPSAT
jgi:TetR/AcrR family transcriptional regulator of autoinduction and epiphytic fitness